MWCNFKFEGVLLRSDSRYKDRVYSIWECAINQTVYLLQGPSKEPHSLPSTGPHLS